MTCKLVVNADSGNFCKLDVDKLLNALGCVDTEIETIDSQTDWSAEGYDTVLIVCGGDGTLHNAIENAATQGLYTLLAERLTKRRIRTTPSCRWGK